MSYILDALKRAETEKDGQGLPLIGLSGAAPASEPVRRPIWRLVTAGAAAFLLLGAGGLYFLGHKEGIFSKSPLTPLFQRGEQETVQGRQIVSPSQREKQQTALPTASGKVTAQAPHSKNNSLQPPQDGKEKQPFVPPLEKGTQLPVPPFEKGGLGGISETTKESLKEPVIPQLIEMPEAFQQSIPPLQFKGHFYSTDLQKGSVVVGEKVFPVGSEIAPGVTLEAVTPTGVILSTRNTRFRIEVLGNWVY